MRLVVASLVLVLAAALAGCAAPEPPAPPVTVASVESVQDVTLSDGRRIHNTAWGAAEPAGTTARERCEARYDLEAARSLLVGAQVADVQVWQRWDGATPGYTPAKLLTVSREQPSGDDLTTVWRSSTINQGRARACPVTEQAPLSGITTEPGVDRVDVDVHDDGESRFCARRWWC